MNAELSYSEIEQLVNQLAHKQLKLSYVDCNTINIAITLEQKEILSLKNVLVDPAPNIFFGAKRFFDKTTNFVKDKISQNISLNLTICNISGNNIIVKYDAILNGGQSSLGNFAIQEYLANHPSKYYQEIDENSLLIPLSQIEKLKQVFQYITIESITFNPNKVIINTTLK